MNNIERNQGIPALGSSIDPAERQRRNARAGRYLLPNLLNGRNIDQEVPTDDPTEPQT